MPLVDLLASVLRALPAVRLAYLFGSRGRGEGAATSDADVAVLLELGSDPRTLDTLTEDLERASNVRVDLVDLRSAPPLLLREVVRDGVVLVCRDEGERACFELGAASSARIDRVPRAREAAFSSLPGPWGRGGGT